MTTAASVGQPFRPPKFALISKLCLLSSRDSYVKGLWLKEGGASKHILTSWPSSFEQHHPLWELLSRLTSPVSSLWTDWTLVRFYTLNICSSGSSCILTDEDQLRTVLVYRTPRNVLMFTKRNRINQLGLQMTLLWRTLRIIHSLLCYLSRCASPFWKRENIRLLVVATWTYVQCLDLIFVCSPTRERTV